jgi:hypothetical protein
LGLEDIWGNLALVLSDIRVERADESWESPDATISYNHKTKQWGAVSPVTYDHRSYMADTRFYLFGGSAPSNFFTPTYKTDGGPNTYFCDYVTMVFPEDDWEEHIAVGGSYKQGTTSQAGIFSVATGLYPWNEGLPYWGRRIVYWDTEGNN